MEQRGLQNLVNLVTRDNRAWLERLRGWRDLSYVQGINVRARRHLQLRGLQ